jgi:15-cis-phytoene synthase
LQAGDRDAAVRTIARDGDLDRYVSALFAPGACREHLFALYAFNVELARIGEQVSEPQLGEIRLQWWRDALDRASSGETTGQPIADAIGFAVRECELSRPSLAGLIDARHFDVSVKIMPDTAVLDDYLANTAGALFKLASEICVAGGPAAEPRALEQAVRAAGIAYGLTGLMRAVPVHVSRGRVDIPEDGLLRHGTSPAQLLAGEGSEGLTELLADLRETARAALGSARQHVAELPPAARPAFLPLALVEPYLSAVQKVDPLRQVADINPLTRLWRLGTWRFRTSA